MAVTGWPDAPEWLDAPGWLDAQEWALGTAAIGAVVIGMAAIGTTGTAIGIIIMTIISSSSVTSAFQGGGAGAEAGDIHMDITAMVAIRTATVVMVMAEAMDTVTTDTETVGYGYGNNSQYGSPTRSKVAELQRRLSRAGYYRGSIDGVLGPQTRRAIRAYEQEHGYADAG